MKLLSGLLNALLADQAQILSIDADGCAEKVSELISKAPSFIRLGLYASIACYGLYAPVVSLLPGKQGGSVAGLRWFRDHGPAPFNSLERVLRTFVVMSSCDQPMSKLHVISSNGDDGRSQLRTSPDRVSW